MIKKKLIAGLAIISTVASLTGCGNTSTTDKTSSKADTKYIAVIGKASGLNFYDNLEKGINKAKEELTDMTVSYTATDNDSNYTDQVKLVESAIADHADAIVISPCIDKFGELDIAINKAKESDIKVVYLISSSSDINTYFVKSNNTEASKIAKENIDKMDRHNVGVIGNYEDSDTCAERISAFTNIIDIAYNENSVDVAAEKTKEMIKHHPEIDVIYATNESTTKGVCQAITDLVNSSAIDKDTIQVVGFNYDAEYKEYFNSGVLDGAIVQDPYTMGYESVKLAADEINGLSVESKIIPFKWVDKTNLNSADIAQLLE